MKTEAEIKADKQSGKTETVEMYRERYVEKTQTEI